MKYVFMLLAVLCFAPSGAYSQILNGGFEDWTGGKPDEWNVVPPDLLTGNATAAAAAGHGGNFCFELNFSAANMGPLGIFLSNSTIAHPSGSAPIKNASSLVFWYKWTQNENYVQLYMTTSRFQDTLLKATNDWIKFSIPITTSTDSIILQFLFNSSVPSNTQVGGSILLDDIAFEIRSSVYSKAFSNTISILPNPISSHSNLHYYLDFTSPIHSSLFDITGREVMQLPPVPFASGDGAIPFDCDGLPNGLYYLRFEAGGNILMRKIIVQH